MAEWSKATVSKIVIPSRVSRVRIPLSPPSVFFLCFFISMILFTRISSCDRRGGENVFAAFVLQGADAVQVSGSTVLNGKRGPMGERAAEMRRMPSKCKLAQVFHAFKYFTGPALDNLRKVAPSPWRGSFRKAVQFGMPRSRGDLLISLPGADSSRWCKTGSAYRVSSSRASRSLPQDGTDFPCRNVD